MIKCIKPLPPVKEKYKILQKLKFYHQTLYLYNTKLIHSRKYFLRIGAFLPNDESILK